MIHKVKLGAILDQVGGLQIRMVLDTNQKHTGEFGIYAGKKLYLKDKDKAQLFTTARKSQSNSPSHHPFRTAFLKWRDTK